MAGTVAVTLSAPPSSTIWEYAISWTADATGVVSLTPVELRNGALWKVQFVPGTPAPTTGYKLTLLDKFGEDVLLGLGNGASGLSATAARSGAPMLPNSFETTPTVQPPNHLSAGNYIPTVSGAGNGGSGTVILSMSQNA